MLQKTVYIIWGIIGLIILLVFGRVSMSHFFNPCRGLAPEIAKASCDISLFNQKLRLEDGEEISEDEWEQTKNTCICAYGSLLEAYRNQEF